MAELDLASLSTEELRGMASRLQAQMDSPDVAGVDKSEGADFITRAGASFKSSPEERLSFIKKRLGAENVATTANGEIVWRKPGDKRWRAFDEAGLSFADVADFAGDVPELVGSTVGAVVGAAGGSVAPGPGTVAGSVGGAAAGGAAGNIIKQAVSALLPGEESVRAVDRLKDVALAGAFSGGAQKVGNVVARKLSPTARAATPESVYTQESDRLADVVKGSLSEGERTGSASLRVTEDYLRRNPSAAGIMADFEVEKQLKPVKAYLDRTLEKLSTSEVPDEALGSAFRSAYDRAAKTLTDQTLRQGEKDFMFLKAAVGDAPIFEPQNFLGELRLLAQRYGDPSMPPDMKKYAAKATELLEHYASNLAGGKYTAQQMQDLLKTYGKAGYGRSPMTILEGLERSDQTRIARDLFQALNKDLESAAAQGAKLPVPAGASAVNVARMLKQARSNYATNIKAVDELGMSVIGKKVGKMKGEVEPERIAEWAQSLRPSGMSATMDILETMRPGIRGETARNMVEKAMIKATDAAKSGGAGPAKSTFSADDLLKHLPDEETLKAVLGPNSPTVKEITDMAAYLGRVTDRSLSSASMQQNPIMSFGRAVLSGNASQAAQQASVFFAPRTMARILTDNEVVKRLRVIKQAAGRRTARVQEAASFLAGKGVPPALLEAMISMRDN